MSDLSPTELPAIDPTLNAEVPVEVPAPVVLPSDGTPYDAAQITDPAPVPAPEPAPLPEAPAEAPVAPVAPVAHEVLAPAGGQLVTLPSGYKVALRSTRSVRARDRKALFVGVDFESTDAMAVGLTVLSNVASLLITDWDVRDFDNVTGAPVGDVLPIPSQTDEDVLGGLSLEDANALDEVTQEAQKVLLPNFAPDPSPASPTQPSAG